MSPRRNGRTLRVRGVAPVAVLAVAAATLLPSAAQAGKAHPGFAVGRHLFALASPAGRSAGHAAAARTRRIPDPAFAGYLTYKTGVTTLTTRYRLPNPKCTKTESAIGPGAFLLTGPRDVTLFNAANIIFGCYHGQTSAQEALVVNNKEFDYTRALGPGDLIIVKLTDNPAGQIVVQLRNLTRGYTLRKSGRPSIVDSEAVGEWGSVDARTQVQLPPPAFGHSTFRGVSIDGRPLGSSSPTGYNMVNSRRVLQIVTHAIGGPGDGTFTCTRTPNGAH
jgi:hypothetical protein